MKKSIFKLTAISVFIIFAALFAVPAAAQTEPKPEELGFNQFRIKSTNYTIVDWGRNLYRVVGSDDISEISITQPYNPETITGELPASLTYGDARYIHVELAGLIYPWDVFTGNQVSALVLTEDSDWGKSYTLTDGSEIPAVIDYYGETYLYVDLFCEKCGFTWVWNGDSATLTLVANRDLPMEIVDSVTREDANGNSWVYSVRAYTKIITFENTTPNSSPFTMYLLHITDEQRGYERVYSVTDASAYEFGEDYVYLLGTGIDDWYPYVRIARFYRILYTSNPDNQDGEEMGSVGYGGSIRVRYYTPIISAGVLYYNTFSSTPGGSGEYSLIAVDSKSSGVVVPTNSGSLISRAKTLFEFNGGFLEYGYEVVEITEVKDDYLYFKITYGDRSSGGETVETIERYKVKGDGSEEPIKIEE